MKTHILILCCLYCWLGFGQAITEAEYFFNTDPGFGNASALNVNGNSGELTQTFTIAVPTDAIGFNNLYIRAKDDNNIWSIYDNRLFYILDTEIGQSATEITAAEYFINSDPGFGNATALTVNPNTGNTTENYAITIGSDLNGFNTLYVRAQDDLGNWSLYNAVKFYVTEELGSGATSISAIEYFIDVDPGFGNGNSVSVASNTGNINQTIIIPLGTLNEGFHNLYLRTQDDLGEWSLYDKRLFFVTPEQEISPIVAAEYFYDTDPGFGNGTAVTLTPTGNTDEFTIDLSTADVTCDFHDFYIRLINADGSWSLYDYGLQVEVFDNADPTIVVFDNITVEVDASGQGSLTITDVDNGTFDDCELVSVELNQAQFNYTCNDLGENTVTITAIDAEDKTSIQDVTVTVVDNINPVAVAQDITVQLDANGTATITTDDLENGSTDNCSIVSRNIDISTFDCSNLGTNTVNFTVEDADGNTNTVQATVTVEDLATPTAIAQNITIQLDNNGEATITADNLDQSTDNCSIVSNAIDIDTFDCNNLGDNTVTLTVTDQSGNSDSTTVTVTVVDTILPTVSTQNVTLQLDANGQASLSADTIDDGSSDNCSIANLSLDTDVFDCSNLGENTITLIVTDQSGNTSTANATVTVEDVISPTANAQNITVQLDANGMATVSSDDVDNNSTDNCGINSKSLDISTFDCSDIGDNIVNLTVTDSSGNSDSSSAIITIEDNEAPSVLTQNISVQLDSNGFATITETDINNGSFDNCGISSTSIDIFNFDCSDVGDNTVILLVTDQYNNSASGTATVTVIDAINPIAIGQDITVDLGGNPSVTISANDLDNGSADNCSNFTLSIDVDTFTEPGVYPVTLTITDASGNTDNVIVNVTVTDTTLNINDNELSVKSILLYPNPTSNVLNFKTDLTIDFIKILDLNGKLLLQTDDQVDKLNVGRLSNGIYFIQFTVQNNIVTKRFIKE